MIKNNQTFEDIIKRTRELAGIKTLNEEVNKGTLATINYTEVIKGVTYGILKEHGSYYIKTSKSGLIKESKEFDYIGGLSNKTEYKYNSYGDAFKNLNMMKITINESLEDKSYSEDQKPLEERLQQDIDNQGQQPPMAPGEQAPMPPQGPSPEPMPSELPPPAPSPEPQGDGSGMPPQDGSAPSPDGQAPVGDDSDLDDNSENDIDHYLGKLTYKISQTPSEELSEDKIKAIMNSIISALPLDILSPEDRLVLAKRVKRGGQKSDDPDAQGQGSDTGMPPQEPAPSPEPNPEEQPVNEGSTQKKIDDIKAKVKVNKTVSEAAEDKLNNLKKPADKKEINEKKYPFDKCEKDQEKEYGSKEVADKVCGAIKAKNEGTVPVVKPDAKGEKSSNKNNVVLDECDCNPEEDKKINEFYSKMDKSQLVYENQHIKYKNVLIESNGKNMIRLSNGDKTFIYNVSPETVKKHYTLVKESENLNEMFGFSSKERGAKTTNNSLQQALAEINKWNGYSIWKEPADIKKPDNIKLIPIALQQTAQELPTVAKLLPEIFSTDNRADYSRCNLNYQGKLLFGIIPNKFYFMKSSDGILLPQGKQELVRLLKTKFGIQ